VFYYFSDHLKTASVITDSAGVIKAESDYYPWGGELQFVNNDSNDYKFTGKKRDIETGLDYFGARYYSNGLGRWVSADWSATPVPVPYANFGDPQSLNLYTYVRNIPSTKMDSDGHCYPVCTVLIGAGVGAAGGALGEFIGQKLRGEKTDFGKIGKAATSGAIAGAITGLAGPEAGLAVKVGLNVGGQVVGGAAERGLNGEKIIDPKQMAIDAGAGLLGSALDSGAEKAFASKAIQKVVPAVADAIVDTSRRATDDKDKGKPQPQPQPKPTPPPPPKPQPDRAEKATGK
jgi:RHS repeat-associated protein